MPTVNIFHQSAEDTVKKLSNLVPALKSYKERASRLWD